MFCAIAQRDVRSPSYERTMIRIPHPVQTFDPGSLLPGFFIVQGVIQSSLHKIKPFPTLAFQLIEPIEG